ncbi:RDD family protein [Listeria innocua]|uniref:RDD family protein n=1 Tax=Listeria innocua TaxID=1642 RepID=UPI00052E6C41|nr:RDD family protein [Listeria innocua]EAD5705313.1 RDD family protein [Listeria innocua]EAD5751995.1 RDD family protein [Listeria innocua]EBB6229288.1 RDD family protein [Listeria innocua]EDO1127310.1 RDD family protein [Listeria innocua]EFO6643234.1 RDD family protein [Listeria innocua]
MKQSPKLKRRFLALLFDYLTILCYMLILFGTSMFIYLIILDGIPIFNELGMNLISLTLIVPVVLFSIITESSKEHATLGKMKIRLMVSSTKSETVKLWQIIVRNIVKFLPRQLAHMAIFHSFILKWEFTPLWTVIMIVVDILPFVWIGFLFRKDHRGIHDLIAKTVVTESDIT